MVKFFIDKKGIDIVIICKNNLVIGHIDLRLRGIL